jgi:hypothetical protein
MLKIVPSSVLGKPCFAIANDKGGFFSCAYLSKEKAEAAMIRVFGGNDDSTCHPMNMARVSPEWILGIEPKKSYDF